MKNNQKYLFLSLATLVAVLGLSLGISGFAQTVAPVRCSVMDSEVSANAAAFLTATGGNGSYSWSGENLSVTNLGGNKLAVTYSTPGTYTVQVASAGQVDTCNIRVIAATAGNVSCSPAVQTIRLGETSRYVATGGTGTYVWTTTDVSSLLPNGTGVTANYQSGGVKTLTVSSGGRVTTCATNVLPGTVTPVFPVTPGFPNTGAGFGQ